MACSLVLSLQKPGVGIRGWFVTLANFAGLFSTPPAVGELGTGVRRGWCGVPGPGGQGLPFPSFLFIPLITFSSSE